MKLPILSSLLLTLLTMSCKSQQADTESNAAATLSQGSQDEGLPTQIKKKPISIQVNPKVHIQISWGVEKTSSGADRITSTYRLSPFTIEVTGIKQASKVYVTLRNTLSTQNLSNGQREEGIIKDYTIPLKEVGLGSSLSYRGDLKNHGFMTDSSNSRQLILGRLDLVPILMSHTYQMHLESTGQILKLLVNDQAIEFTSEQTKELSLNLQNDLDTPSF
jgi:hypothetical protein